MSGYLKNRQGAGWGRFHSSGYLCALSAAILLAGSTAAAQPAAPAPPPPPPSSQPAAPPATLVVEGFEKLNIVRSWPEKLEPVTEGEGVTEGKLAARVPGGQSILVKLRGADCRQYGWLKFDVLTLQPLSQPFHLVASGTDWQREAYAYAQAGKDTVAMPMSLFFQQGCPDEVELTLVNTSDRAAILDNIRLERPAALPPGCLAIHFGNDGHPLWPGFATAGTRCPQVVWSGKAGLWAAQLPFPDLLTGSFAGPSPGPKSADTFDLVAPDKNCTAWLWITHYGGNFTQPLEYLLSCQGKVLAQRKIGRDQLFTAEGLMEGMGGEWSPKWFDSVYAPRFTEVVKLQLAEARTPVSVGNCQLAALAIAPPAAKAAMTTYVAGVQADVSRYRRQFVVGLRNDARCDLNPTEAEAKAGFVLLCPPPEDAFAAGWKPRGTDRAEKVSVVAAGGLLAAVPLAIAPLKKTLALSATLGPLYSADGHTLTCERDSTDVLFCKTVPRVLRAGASQQPWILTHKNAALGEMQLAWMVLKLTPALDAKSGLYQGAIRVSLGTTTAQIPLEVKVLQIAPEARDVPTIGLLHADYPEAFYSYLASENIAQPGRDALQKTAALELMESANALCVPGMFLNGDLTLWEGPFTGALRNYPARTARGYALFDSQQALDSILGAKTPPGSRQYEQVATQLVAKTASLAAGAGVKDYHIVIGTSFEMNPLKDRITLAAALQAAGGSPALFVSDGDFAQLPREEVQSLYSSAGALVLGNWRQNLAAAVEAYKKIKPNGRVYVFCDSPDRFAAGLFAAGVGADGTYFNGAGMGSGIYNGFFLSGPGLLVLDSDGALAPTAEKLWLQQGQADFLLVKRAEALARKAADAKVAVPQLAKALADLKAVLAKRQVGYWDSTNLRSAGATRTETESWRITLLEACAKAWEALTPQPAKAGG